MERNAKNIYIMKAFISFLCAGILAVCVCSLPSSSGEVEAVSPTKSETYEVAGAEAMCSSAELATYPASGAVAHFFTHALIAHPEIAFDSANAMSVHYDRDCITPSEFKAVLSSLYERGYVLVDIAKTYTSSGSARRRDFSFPAGKKPLVLSFDDINYYVKKMNLGMNDRLDVDERGRFFTYTEKADEKISYDNEVVTVLENFIAAHPDFSFDGARGVLCLTGFDGVLGYRTNRDSPTRASELGRAKRVIAALKAQGWKFACHSYGHYHMKKLSARRFMLDTDRWLGEVSPLVGDTDIYVYPYGEWEISDGERMSAKHAYLKEKGFRLFCGVGAKDYFTLHCGDNLFMDRKPLDGYSLRARANEYAPYFDAAAVYDPCRPVAFREKSDAKKLNI